MSEIESEALTPRQRVEEQKRRLEEIMNDLEKELGGGARDSGVYQQYEEQLGAIESQLENFDREDQAKHPPKSSE